MTPDAPIRALVAAERSGLLPAGRLLVACSGGGDSMALLHASTVSGLWDVSAVYIDHGWGAHSEAASAHVSAACAALNLPIFKMKVTCDRGEGPEDQARRARLQALDALAAAQAFDCIALAHTRDDQVETILMRLASGAGLRGLAGMPTRRGRLRRPWLDVDRDEIRAWLRARSIEWVEDPTNQDLRFLRGRIRQLALPALDAVFSPSWRGAAATSATHLRAADDLVEALTDSAEAGFKGSSWSVPALRALPDVVRHRLIGRRLGGDGRRQREALAVIDAVLARPEGTVVRSLPGRLVVERAYGRVRFGPPLRPPESPPSLEIAGPGVVAWGRLRFTIGAAHEIEPAGADALESLRVDAAQTPFPWTLRAAHPTDRMRPLGAPGSKRLGRLFSDARVPREARAGPVLCDADGPFWARGLRIADRVAVGLGPAWIIRVAPIESSPSPVASDAHQPLPAG